MTQRNVKIVATLGPSSSSRRVIESLVHAGVNVFRLNMSHGGYEDIAAVHEYIRSVEMQAGFPIAILGDLQGPKLRCGVFEKDGAALVAGEMFTFDLDSIPGDSTRVELPHPEIFQALKPGATMLVDDGLVRLEVLECSASHAQCKVIVGGVVSNRKGVNVPSVVLPLSSLSGKDRQDLEFLCELGIDWIALSFVQRADDIIEARKLVQGRAKLVAKIEKPAALNVIDEIISLSDGIMVARGDLGVELPVHSLPPIQKQLIRSCRAAGKPVIVATQMLESMVTAPVPTRAEVSDIATAIYDGADAIMLSAESAVGEYPVAAVSTMVAVATEVESDPGYRLSIHSEKLEASAVGRVPLTIAARELADKGDVQAICCFTQSGYTALSQARERPCVPVLALTPDSHTARQLSLVWGVTCRVVGPVARFKGAVAEAVQQVRTLHLAAEDGMIAVTAGIPVHRTGATNILRLAAVDGSDIHQME